LKLDFGTELGVKKSSAQITDLYEKEELVGKQVLAVVNFPPKQIGPFMSECFKSIEICFLKAQKISKKVKLLV